MASANTDSKHSTAINGSIFGFDDLDGALGEAAGQQYEPQTDSESGYDTVADGSGSDEDAPKKSKRAAKVKVQKDNTMMVKTPVGDGANSKLMGKLQDFNLVQFSNPHDVSGKQTVTVGDGKTVDFKPIAFFTKAKGYTVAFVAQLTVPQAFASQSKHTSGAAARADRIAKEPKAGEVRGEKLAVYYNPAGGVGSICVNRKQLCSVCFVTDKAFAKITAGNLFHTSEISLSEHDSNIPVVSVELATFMLSTVAPTTATYNLYKTAVEGLAIRQNVCWNQWFVSLLNKFVTSVALNMNSSDGVAMQLKQLEMVRAELSAKIKLAEANAAKQMALHQKALQKAKTVEESINWLPSGFKQFAQALTVDSSEAAVRKAMADFMGFVKIQHEASQKAKAARAAGGAAAQNAASQAPKRPATVTASAAAAPAPAVRAANLYAAAAGAAGAPVNDETMGQ